jgi:origin recognition complex subunit 1
VSRTPIHKPSPIRRASPRLAEKSPAIAPNEGSIKKQNVVKSLKFAPSTPKRNNLEKRLASRSPNVKVTTPSKQSKKKWLDHVILERVKFSVGDDVYVRRTDEEIDEEAEGCLICGKTGKLVECDNCSRGIHLRCNKPPLKKVPEGDWLCPRCDPSGSSPDFSDASLIQKNAEPPRTARELLLASKLWAARIERYF